MTETPDQAAAAPLSILVVDDENEVADMLSQMLAADSHRVEIAHRGSTALELLSEHDYDVILSDLRMHEMDGEDFYRALQKDRRGLLSRLAFVTGDTVSPMARRFLKSANCPYIEKPVMPDELRNLVRRVADDNPLTHSETRTLTMMAAQSNIAVVDDEADIRDMLQDYLQLHGMNVITCADGGPNACAS